MDGNISLRMEYGVINVGYKFRFFLAIFSLGFSGAVYAGKFVKAKKDGVKVYAEASKKADVLTTLTKGQSLDASERKGMYWQVKVSGKLAFVSVFKVKKVNKSSAIAEALKDAVKQGREEGDGANVRARSAVMGVRGLDESDSSSFAGNVKPNLRMVYAMEDLLVGSDQLSLHENSVFNEAERNALKKGL